MRIFYEAVLNYVQGDFDKARASLVRASDEDSRALLFLGQMASRGEGEPANPGRAAQYYQLAASAGVAEAAYNLGALYALGRGVPKNSSKALRWYRRAAELGDIDGAFKVGTMLALGEVGAVDFVEPERLWRENARKGHVPSVLFLGNLHNGLGPKKSVCEATRWYLQAARMGDPEGLAAAQALVGRLQEEARAGSTEAASRLGEFITLQGSPEEALPWLEQAASKGDAAAKRTLGCLYADGSGVAQDLAQANALFTEAALAGDALAQLLLGSRLVDGSGTAKDVDRGLELLAEAASQGLSDAAARLGDALSSLERDEQARRALEQAALSGHVGAMRAVGDWYRDGFGGPADPIQALKWYLKLLQAGDGNRVHESHRLADEMSPEEICEAAILAGDPTLAKAMLAELQCCADENDEEEEEGPEDARPTFDEFVRLHYGSLLLGAGVEEDVVTDQAADSLADFFRAKTGSPYPQGLFRGAIDQTEPALRAAYSRGELRPGSSPEIRRLVALFLWSD